MWGRVEYNIIACCATERDRYDIGWFVVYCIQQSQKSRSYWWFVVYYILQSQSIIGVSGVASRVIGRMGQCEECMHLQEISKD